MSARSPSLLVPTVSASAPRHTIRVSDDDDEDDDETFDEMLRRVSKPTGDELVRRVEALLTLPPTNLRAELHRGHRTDLEDLVIFLLDERRRGGLAGAPDTPSRRATAVHADAVVAIDFGDDSDDGRTRRGAMPGAAGFHPRDSVSTTTGSSRRVSVMASPGLGSSNSRNSSLAGDLGTPRRRGLSRVVVAGRARQPSSDRTGSSATRDDDLASEGRAPSASNPLALPPVDDFDDGARRHGTSPSIHRMSSSEPKSSVMLSTSQLRHHSVMTQMTHRSIEEHDGGHEHRRQSGTPAIVKLKQLYFYQDYVSDRFSDGRAIQDTIRELRAAGRVPDTIPPLRVARRSTDGKYYSLCNRRLACYHFVFGRTNPNIEIPVLMRREPAEHMLPQGDGKGISVRVGGGIVIDGCLVWEIRHCLHPR